MSIVGSHKGSVEIRDPIHGPISVSREEIEIVDSPYVQRLRGIKQLGFAELAFPGATHNRYSHSLGAFYLAGRAFDRIFKDFDWKDTEERESFRFILRMGALLHDSGHGPLSHAIEQAMPLKKDVVGHSEFPDQQASHEDYTEAILLKSSLTEKLQKVFSKQMPQKVAALIRCENSNPEFFKAGKSNLNIFPLLSALISGELDVDRMDYMVRDSLYCGIPYGHFDRDWILSNLTFLEKDSSVFLALDARAMYAFEDFLLSRYHLYLMVYLHHKSVIYDEMLFQFLKSSASDTRLPSSVEDYLQVDDYWLRSRLRQTQNPWAKRIIEQKPYKMLLEIHSEQNEEAKTYADDLERKLKDANINYFRSSSTGLLSRYAQAGAKVQSNPIYAVYRDPRFLSSHKPGTTHELLSQATELFQRYRNSRIIDRVYAERDLG
ncbi:MAG: HD domain-containing protein [Deltaproteobacteria bacterium]|nr:HD domain-containing protein [Deltaproteobacteria bacterium]